MTTPRATVHASARAFVVYRLSRMRWTGLGLSACAAIVAAAAFFAVPGGATACACGERNGVVVAHGKSLYGAPWRIKAGLLPRLGPQPRSLELHFSVGPAGSADGVGYFKYLPLPLHPRFVLSATGGSEINEYPESDLSGVTSWRVASLIVEMGEGDPLTVFPVSAPEGIRKRFRWLRGTRFFSIFFPSSREPDLVTAFDRSGRVLARARGDRGQFLGLRSCC